MTTEYPDDDLIPDGGHAGLSDTPPAAAYEGPHLDAGAPPISPLEGPIVGDYSAAPQEDGDYGGRIAPCNIEAEQAVLGALLLQNETYFRLSGFLKADYFYEPLHARLYSAMEDLIATGRVADPVTLKPRFEDDQDMAEVGGIGYLANLASASISLMNAVDYGRAIFDMAIRRGLIHIGEEMVSGAMMATPNSSRGIRSKTPKPRSIHSPKPASTKAALSSFQRL